MLRRLPCVRIAAITPALPRRRSSSSTAGSSRNSSALLAVFTVGLDQFQESVSSFKFQVSKAPHLAIKACLPTRNLKLVFETRNLKLLYYSFLKLETRNLKLLFYLQRSALRSRKPIAIPATISRAVALGSKNGIQRVPRLGNLQHADGRDLHAASAARAADRVLLAGLVLATTAGAQTILHLRNRDDRSSVSLNRLAEDVLHFSRGGKAVGQA